MKKQRSVGALILASTSLLAVMLALVFFVIAAGAVQRQRMAAQDMRAIEEARRLLVARQAVRLESGVLTAALVTPEPANAAVLRQLVAMNAISVAALNAVRADMERDPRAKNILALFVRKHQAAEGQRMRAMRDLGVPKAIRPETLYGDYSGTTRARLEVLDLRAGALSNDVARSDRFNSQMMKINDLVWRLRIDTGYDRGNITRVLQQAAPVSWKQRDEFLRSDGRIDSVWESIQAETRAAGVPAALLESVEAAGDSYFRAYRPLRHHIVRELVSGHTVVLSGAEWLKRSNPGLSSITAISHTVFSLTEAHARSELRAADIRLMASILLMLVAIGLGWFVRFYLKKHIVQPLRIITGSINKVGAGDRLATAAFEERGDEIGEFARGLRLMRESNQERRHLEAARHAADMANRVKSEFLANMSHELRTPLNAIIGFSEIMRGQMFGPLTERYAEYSGLINQSGQHLLNLVSDILDLSKVEAGKWEIAPVEIDLEQTVDYCLRMVSQRAENRMVQLTKNLSAAPRLLLADERACRQILLNLLTNAVKFSREGGEVTISAALSGDMVCIAVRDNGIGIPASELPRIGNAFEQASNNAFVASEGTGLGLALVKSLASLHKGSFVIESTEGIGTTVTIGFPLRAAAAEIAA